VALFSGLMGHAGDFDREQAAAQYARLLDGSEQVEIAFRLVRDVIILTNRRVILVDRQGITGRKTEYLSIPYRSITRFSVESAGSFDLDAELKIWVSGAAEPIARTFNARVDVYALQATIARHMP
jgi:hypothetical protein